eukprot:TRINITY_DN39486_c0_g1_i1.p1 TRINITY_DN39486_c0_g1~~TRINITY_DN39486_c0_g1_i1.p1  ORF type:complete len:1099 (+),score=161.87 TRINITY_DN39486_c0_g1_i1:69-3365(+)
MTCTSQVLGFGVFSLFCIDVQNAVATQLGGNHCPYHSAIPNCNLENGTDFDVVVNEDCILGRRSKHQHLVVRTLTVEKGALLLLDRGELVDMHLAAGAIRLDGELWVGCPGGEQDAFQGKLAIELTGSTSSESSHITFNWWKAGLPDVSGTKQDSHFTKALVVTNSGRLELHGRPTASWQYLTATAASGARQLQLDSPVHWEAGDEVVIGSTTEDASQSEVAIVKSTAGQIVTLQRGLSFTHMGSFEGRGTPLNAPVGLRTHNIKVRGRMADGSPSKEQEALKACMQSFSNFAMDAGEVKKLCFGGHTLFTQNSTVRIENTEFSSLGQALVMARYPVHWHLAGNASSQYIRNSSLHNNFHRCVTIHGTADTLIENNVCHETHGHAFYLEDGIETGNVFHRNLVISSHPGGSVCTDFERGKGPRANTQLGPSGFWITNPDNSFRQNHVIGVGTGYWFTFPMQPGKSCGLAPGSAQSCNQAGGVFGLSKHYFEDNRSGYGTGSWWLSQEQARTPVRMFRGNVVSSAYRGIHIDGRVFSSSDAHLSDTDDACLSDACPTCSGPLEGSFSWVPLLFDPQLPVHQRTYHPTVNEFEDFYASHIRPSSPSDESRCLWASGGLLRFTGATFLNNYMVATVMEELTTACLKVTADSPPGFTVVFEDSLFISGPLSSTFFQVYDAGIHVVNSNWILADGTVADFHVVKPKCAFGGNGNPIYFQNSSALTAGVLRPRAAWAAHLVRAKAARHNQIASFECLAWSSPYTKGSYVYSSDSFGMGDGGPGLLAPARGQDSELGKSVRLIQGAENCAHYLRDSLPRFFCGEAFGTYGRWCGSGIQLVDCPGVIERAAHWYRSLHPFSEMNGTSSPHPEPNVADLKGPPSLLLPKGKCYFPVQPPARTPFFWDTACAADGGVGCNADGQHMECRWCGFEPYLACPRMPETPEDVPQPSRSWLFGGLALVLCVGGFAFVHYAGRCRLLRRLLSGRDWFGFARSSCRVSAQQSEARPVSPSLLVNNLVVATPTPPPEAPTSSFTLLGRTHLEQSGEEKDIALKEVRIIPSQFPASHLTPPPCPPPQRAGWQPRTSFPALPARKLPMSKVQPGVGP